MLPVRKPTPPAELERLQEYLGTFGDVVQRYDADAAHPSNWAAKVWGTYRVPGGTATVTTQLWTGVDPATVPALLATALENLLTDRPRTAFSVPLFESFLTKAIAGPKPYVPSVQPGTEHALVRSNGHRSEHPGEARTFRREGTGMATITESSRAYLRQLAESKAGPGADPAEVDRIYAEKLAEAEQHAAARASA